MTRDCETFEYPDPTANFMLGLKVVGSELTWIFIDLLRRFEIRQLKRRLKAEREALSRVSPAHADTPQARLEAGEKISLTRKQISFLEEEIVYLSRERQARRKEFIASRIAKWGLEK